MWIFNGVINGKPVRDRTISHKDAADHIGGAALLEQLQHTGAFFKVEGGAINWQKQVKFWLMFQNGDSQWWERRYSEPTTNVDFMMGIKEDYPYIQSCTKASELATYQRDMLAEVKKFYFEYVSSEDNGKYVWEVWATDFIRAVAAFQLKDFKTNAVYNVFDETWKKVECVSVEKHQRYFINKIRTVVGHLQQDDQFWELMLNKSSPTLKKRLRQNRKFLRELIGSALDLKVDEVKPDGSGDKAEYLWVFVKNYSTAIAKIEL